MCYHLIDFIRYRLETLYRHRMDIQLRLVLMTEGVVAFIDEAIGPLVLRYCQLFKSITITLVLYSAEVVLL